MGTPETLCQGSCRNAIETDCSSTVSKLMLQNVQLAVCGDEKDPLEGVSDDGKCFTTKYDGPEKDIWIIGFIIAVIFSFLASVGINLQKKALKQNELAAMPKPPYRLPLWLFGFMLCLVGSILDFVAFGLAPQSLLAPLAALTLVWNMMLAPCFNKEKLSRKDLVSTLVIFVGATIAVVFASHSSPSYNLDMLMQLYRDPLTIVYFCVVFLVLAMHFATVKIVDRLCLLSNQHRIIRVGSPAVWATLRLVGYAGLAGTLGGQSILFAKSSAELLKGVFKGDTSCFVRYQTYIIVLALVICLCLQIKYLNDGLVHYDALSMVPVYQAYWIISGVLGGVIYFQEIRTFSVLQVVMFVLGICISIFGVVLLSRRKHAPSIVSSQRNEERGSSFTSSSAWQSIVSASSDICLARNSESVSKNALVVEKPASRCVKTSRQSLSTVINAPDGRATTADFDSGGNDQDRPSHDETSEHVNRQAIDNYLNLSTTVGLSEILSGLGLSCSHNSDLSSWSDSTRPVRRCACRSVDDIKVGLPAASRPTVSQSWRHSITLSDFSSASTETEKVKEILPSKNVM
uniref:Uncharacterized protein n=1 Tax=Hyaloperonospora arabidopsidis (strain Emoy2) TaxID=559515 RepID=M4BKD1_HYAAE